MAAATGEAPVVDEKALKIQMAQKKAAVMTKTREEARAKGLSPEDEKAAVQAALQKFEEEQAAAAAGGSRRRRRIRKASKIELAQKKAALITKTRAEARAKGLSPEEERAVVAEALKAFSEPPATAARACGCAGSGGGTG